MRPIHWNTSLLHWICKLSPLTCLYISSPGQSANTSGTSTPSELKANLFPSKGGRATTLPRGIWGIALPRGSMLPRGKIDCGSIGGPVFLQLPKGTELSQRASCFWKLLESGQSDSFCKPKTCEVSKSLNRSFHSWSQFARQMNSAQNSQLILSNCHKRPLPDFSRVGDDALQGGAPQEFDAEFCWRWQDLSPAPRGQNGRTFCHPTNDLVYMSIIFYYIVAWSSLNMATCHL